MGRALYWHFAGVSPSVISFKSLETAEKNALKIKVLAYHTCIPFKTRLDPPDSH